MVLTISHDVLSQSGHQLNFSVSSLKLIINVDDYFNNSKLFILDFKNNKNMHDETFEKENLLLMVKFHRMRSGRRGQ